MPRILGSARKNGCSDEDILHAYRNPRLDKPTEDNLGNVVRAIVGPNRTGTAELELLVSLDDDERIFHAYEPARPGFPR